MFWKPVSICVSRFEGVVSLNCVILHFPVVFHILGCLAPDFRILPIDTSASYFKYFWSLGYNNPEGGVNVYEVVSDEPYFGLATNQLQCFPP